MEHKDHMVTILPTILTDIAKRCPDTITGDLKKGYTIHPGLKMEVSFKNGDLRADVLAGVTMIVTVDDDIICLKGERKQLKYVRLSDVTIVSATEAEGSVTRADDMPNATGAGFLR